MDVAQFPEGEVEENLSKGWAASCRPPCFVSGAVDRSPAGFGEEGGIIGEGLWFDEDQFSAVGEAAAGGEVDEVLAEVEGELGLWGVGEEDGGMDGAEGLAGVLAGAVVVVGEFLFLESFGGEAGGAECGGEGLGDSGDQFEAEITDAEEEGGMFGKGEEVEATGHGGGFEEREQMVVAAEAGEGGEAAGTAQDHALFLICEVGEAAELVVPEFVILEEGVGGVEEGPDILQGDAVLQFPFAFEDLGFEADAGGLGLFRQAPCLDMDGEGESAGGGRDDGIEDLQELVDGMDVVDGGGVVAVVFMPDMCRMGAMLETRRTGRFLSWILARCTKWRGEWGQIALLRIGGRVRIGGLEPGVGVTFGAADGIGDVGTAVALGPVGSDGGIDGGLVFDFGVEFRAEEVEGDAGRDQGDAVALQGKGGAPEGVLPGWPGHLPGVACPAAVLGAEVIAAFSEVAGGGFGAHGVGLKVDRGIGRRRSP